MGILSEKKNRYLFFKNLLMNCFFLITKPVNFILIIFLFSSCVTNRDLEYIRSIDEVKEIKKNLQSYSLQSGDLLSVQISTSTEQQHDFFNKESSANYQLFIQNPYLYGYLIDDEGNLELPTLGLIKAAGFTLAELENVIKNISTSHFLFKLPCKVSRVPFLVFTTN